MAVQTYYRERVEVYGGYIPLNHYDIPFYGCPVSAGFPSPADDYVEPTLDLNDLLIQNPVATFMVRASGDSMTPAGIFDGDVLVVDRSITAKAGRVVVAAINGELTVKRVRYQGSTMFLDPDNKRYPPIEVTEFTDLTIWGVVTNVIHKMI
ncbi:MAG: translesion error-prone DNA polymerase V autoproteolytic subunit [Cyanobacteria bacterium P01_D01_bin.156]